MQQILILFLLFPMRYRSCPDRRVGNQHLVQRSERRGLGTAHNQELEKSPHLN